MSNYNKLRKIGEGSFGKVWLVEDGKIEKLFVIKEVKIVKMEEKTKSLAISEVMILSNLKHPNIVLYIDSFIENNTYLCIVTEYCEGGDLFSKIIARKEKSIPFTEEQIIEWFLQLTSALNYIHSRKILHRDLKSQNVFLKNNCVKLGDFGIARVLTNTLELARTCIGTPVAFSPEIVQGEPYNHKSDIWSLGCIMYELAMLKLPFTADNMNGLFCKILRANFEPIKFYYSQELSEVISQMLRRSPDRRPNTDDILKLPLQRKRATKEEDSEIKRPNAFACLINNSENMKKLDVPLRIQVQPSTKQKPLSRPQSEERKSYCRALSCNSSASKCNSQSRKLSAEVSHRKFEVDSGKKQLKPTRSSIQAKITEKPPSPYRLVIKNVKKEKENQTPELLPCIRSKVPKWVPSKRVIN